MNNTNLTHISPLYVARSILVSVFGKSHLRVASLLMLMGALDFRSGDMDQARALLEESIQIRKAKGATNDKDYEKIQSLLESIDKSARGSKIPAKISSAEAQSSR